ncbi:hypothetical protein JYK02_33765 [Corallococcus macrosporus]|uniref:Cytochrome c domain-containing protein n=1 Tax=Corallococcus macrosporus TaxID=35 RepID=A0ABS3DMD5_9BACT|nr:hypothetical protein [Corallococcus macrosporus]MBN8232495.1 hypothetical protein [Corallococcus macrosporus]
MSFPPLAPVLDLFANPSAARRPYRAPLATLFAAALLATTAGCAGGLDEPERFTGASSCAPGTTASSIIQAQCYSCHSTETKASGGGFDLQAAGLPGRLYTTNATCNSQPLADSANPSQSFFLKKLTPSPGCGGQMPLGGSLNAADTACLTEWLVAGKPSP